MIAENLEDKYPNLRATAKKYDCSFSEAIKIIEDSKKQNTLKRFL